MEVDAGYNGEMVFTRLNDFHGVVEWKWMKGQARARHENINGKFKEFNLLSTRYHNARKQHGFYFRAVSAVVQFEIQQGGITHQIDYNINPADLP